VQIIVRQRKRPATHPSEPAPHRVAKVGKGAEGKASSPVLSARSSSGERTFAVPHDSGQDAPGTGRWDAVG